MGDYFSVTDNAGWVYEWSVENGSGLVSGTGSEVYVSWRTNEEIFTGADEGEIFVTRKVTVSIKTSSGAVCSKILEWDVTVYPFRGT